MYTQELTRGDFDKYRAKRYDTDASVQPFVRSANRYASAASRGSGSGNGAHIRGLNLALLRLSRRPPSSIRSDQNHLCIRRWPFGSFSLELSRQR